MKTIFLTTAALVASSCFASLTPATGDRLADYNNWFAPFKVASDGNVTGIPNPRVGFPDSVQADTVNRDWSGFSENWGATSLVAPTFSGTKPVTVEIVFLGESAGWWDDFGVRVNGTNVLLADGIQAVGDQTMSFGDFTYITIDPTDDLDFFITGSGVKKQDGQITTSGLGGIFYAYDKSLNSGGSVQQSYFGTLDPLQSVGGANLGAFTVLGFEDTRVTSGKADQDYNDLLYAVRFLTPSSTAVPEPSTYGMFAAFMLLGLVGWRRRARSA